MGYCTCQTVFIGLSEWRELTVPVFIMILDTNCHKLKYQYNSEIQYTNQNSCYNYGNSGEKQSYFWHGDFPYSLRTQSPATGRKSMCPRCPAGTVLAVSFSKFMRQWHKNAASAEHCIWYFHNAEMSFQL